jgi:SagB-type dehydrogenase family enzyme
LPPDLPETTRLTRSPSLLVRWAGENIVCIDALNGCEYELSAGMLQLLDLACPPKTRGELARQAGVPTGLVDELARLGLLLPDRDARSLGESMSFWTLPELAAFSLSAHGGRRKHPFEQHMPSDRCDYPGRQIPLTPLARASHKSFADVLSGRRSTRVFSSAHLRLADVAALLMGSALVQMQSDTPGKSFRPYPSAGGRHPLELYLLPVRMEELRECTYYFDPYNGCLVELADTIAADSGLVGVLETAPARGEATSEPGAILAIMAAFPRTQWLYSRSALAMVYRDTGALMQTLHLQATALGLAGYALSGGPQEMVLGGARTDPLRFGYTGAFLVGYPANEVS